MQQITGAFVWMGGAAGKIDTSVKLSPSVAEVECDEELLDRDD